MMFKLTLEESNKLEYKSSLPKNNRKWLKTISSFSNTAGGQIIVGVNDETKEVIGINEPRSKIEEFIFDTIYNNILPTPVIDVSFQNYGDKDVLIINVSRGNSSPYSVEVGNLSEIFVRFGSTDRIATFAQVEEMKLSSQRLGFTDLLYHDKSYNKYSFSNAELKEFINRIQPSDSQRKINVNKLKEWGLIIEEFEKLFATNGLMLLNSNPFNYAMIKIGIFDGVTKTHMIDEIIIDGTIIDQYEECVKIIQNYLNKGFNFKFDRRREYYVPEEVIREIVANAVIHRNYYEEEPIRIELYSDRISIFSPGSLYDGIQYEDIISGVSKLRNTNIAEIFHCLGYVEKWGSGIRRANEHLENHNMKPLNIDTENVHGVTVTIEYGENTIKEQRLKNVIPTTDDIVNYYSTKDKSFKRRDLQNDFKITERQSRTIVETMLVKDIIERCGSGPSTYYKIIK